jgi:hypothetical protein
MTTPQQKLHCYGVQPKLAKTKTPGQRKNSNKNVTQTLDNAAQP